jgi:hypothetical protein
MIPMTMKPGPACHGHTKLQRAGLSSGSFPAPSRSLSRFACAPSLSLSPFFHNLQSLSFPVYLFVLILQGGVGGGLLQRDQVGSRVAGGGLGLAEDRDTN